MKKDFVSLLVIMILLAVASYAYVEWRNNSVARVTISEILTSTESPSAEEKSQINKTDAKVSTNIKPTTSTNIELNKADKVQVYINVIDKDGLPFKPDNVEWYYPTVNGGADQYPANCSNTGCTRWSVIGATSSKIYVTASYRVPSHPDAACFSLAYDAKPVQLSSIPAEVTLKMEPEKWCY